MSSCRDSWWWWIGGILNGESCNSLDVRTSYGFTPSAGGSGLWNSGIAASFSPSDGIWKTGYPVSIGIIGGCFSNLAWWISGTSVTCVTTFTGRCCAVGCCCTTDGCSTTDSGDVTGCLRVDISCGESFNPRFIRLSLSVKGFAMSVGKLVSSCNMEASSANKFARPFKYSDFCFINSTDPSKLFNLLGSMFSLFVTDLDSASMVSALFRSFSELYLSTRAIFNIEFISLLISCKFGRL